MMWTLMSCCSLRMFILEVGLVVTLIGSTGCARPQEHQSIQVLRLSDSLIAFYEERPSLSVIAERAPTWDNFGALNLGIATYAIHQNGVALVFDTFTDPARAGWVRRYLQRMGITRFIVVNSHWHLDHIGGNVAYADAVIIASNRTRDILAELQSDIEMGRVWGPPAIDPLQLPNVTFEGKLTLHIGSIEVELHSVNIHSADSVVAYIPSHRILLAGDTLEDTIPLLAEPERLIERIANLAVLREWDIGRIYPNHGDLEVIRTGGYGKGLINATINYFRELVARAGDADILEGTLEDYVADSVEQGWVSVWEPYRDVHRSNLESIQGAYRGGLLDRDGDKSQFNSRRNSSGCPRLDEIVR